MHSAQPRSRSLLAAVGWLVGVAAVAAGVHQGWRATWLPHGIPSLDVADYLVSALALRDAWLASDPAAFASAMLAPNVHPPLHPLVLAAWTLVRGASIASAAEVAALTWVAALGALIWLGHRAHPIYGRWAGLAAAALTAASVEHQRLSAAPMTENLALLALLLALGAASTRAGLVAGACVCLAALVRYNLAPMLVVPIVIAHVVESRNARRSFRGLALTMLPTLAVLVAWTAARPELPSFLGSFFRNVDSGLPTWSAENLAWLPTAFALGYTGNTAVAAGVGVLLLASAASWTPEARKDDARRVERLLQVFVLTAVVAITVHPYKLTRVLHGVVPVAYLVATLTVARAANALPLARLPVVAGALGLALLLHRANGAAGRHGRLEFAAGADTTKALDRAVLAMDGSAEVILSGSHAVLNLHTLELWYRMGHPNARVLADLAGCQGCVPPETRRALEERRTGVAIVTVEREARDPDRPVRRRSGNVKPAGTDSSEASAREVAALAATMGVRETASIELPRLHAKVSVYRILPAATTGGRPAPPL